MAPAQRHLMTQLIRAHLSVAKKDQRNACEASPTRLLRQHQTAT